MARIPVGLALLFFNTYPLWTAAAVWAIYGNRPERAVLIAMPVILFGLVLALTQHEVADLDGRLRTAITMGIVSVLARVGSSPFLNVEPVAALGMAWLLLGQSVSLVQVLGALLVVGSVMVLGLRRR